MFGRKKAAELTRSESGLLSLPELVLDRDSGDLMLPPGDPANPC
jgi:hypothetical protein